MINMKKIKTFLKYIIENVIRTIKNHYASILFLSKGSIFRKPLHVQGFKYFEIGQKVSIDSYSRIDVYKTNDCAPKLTIGNNVMISFNCTLLITSNLFIGENTTIASKVLITTENHGTNPIKGNYCHQELSSKDVHIGRNCWLGESVIVLPGVNIGDFSIIGAGSIVTHNIPNYSMAVGNPAKVIKRWNFKTESWEGVKEYER